ncbi:MAG: hypothetical protein AYK23_00150 [Candidatus Proteinoplasmatales archaeon SG8-5]|nr:MAG: hypothetical protein AYK23_00150 [Candidatus Proteinoplasmatales archaeon SG8-5]
MDKRKMKRLLISIARDLMLAFFVVLLVMLILYAYCRVWPPMVVVESGSMEHPPSPGVRKSYIGVIDTGDMVFVKDVEGSDGLMSYMDGEATGYRRYGSFGDVVIYRPDGLRERVPIIHRLLVWVEVNNSNASPIVGNSIDYGNYSYDIPSLGLYGSRENVILNNYGYSHKSVSINLTTVIRNFYLHRMEPHSGYITLGDNNPNIDQLTYLPVKEEWIVGKAIGELPWFGLIKLSITDHPVDAPGNSWISLFAVIIIIISIPIFLDYGWPRVRKRLFVKDSKDVQDGGEVEGPDTANEETPRHREGVTKEPDKTAKQESQNAEGSPEPENDEVGISEDVAEDPPRNSD